MTNLDKTHVGSSYSPLDGGQVSVRGEGAGVEGRTQEVTEGAAAQEKGQKGRIIGIRNDLKNQLCGQREYAGVRHCLLCTDGSNWWLRLVVEVDQ